MKIMIFSDIHGNYQALEAVLTIIAKESPDLIVCAGDIINPFPGSHRVWKKLKMMNIPLLKGNHEEYIVHYKQPPADLSTVLRIQYQPVIERTKDFTLNEIKEINRLPLEIILKGPKNNNIFICHASPGHTSRSFYLHNDASMEKSLKAAGCPVIIAGHIHRQWQGYRQEKLLALTGSVGLPFNELKKSEYLIAEYYQGNWRLQHKLAEYDYPAALKEVVESNFLSSGGPIAWLMFDELLSGKVRLCIFINTVYAKLRPKSLMDWENSVITFLKSENRWDAIKHYL